MIPRRAQVRRKGHGKCGLFPNRTLSNNRAELPSSGVLAHTETGLHNVWSPMVNSETEGFSTCVVVWAGNRFT